MIIANSTMKMESTHELDVRHQESVIRRTIARQNLPEERRPAENEKAPSAKRASLPALSREARILLPPGSAIQYTPFAVEPHAASVVTDTPEDGPASEQSVKLSVLLKTLEKMTGKSYRLSPISFMPVSESLPPGSHAAGQLSVEALPASRQPPIAPANSVASQVETITTYHHRETERTRFAATGTIQTADGREIEMDVQLNMSRDFFETNVSYTVDTRPLTDPLVINWNGNAVDLTEKKYAFDLDSDGVKEQISFVTPESGGFLAYDRNRDGVINNGAELFGPTQGNGFSELARYDEDGNGWIDEGDTVFFDLSIWSKTPDGQDHLIAVADTGIGAIYLNAADTPFSVNTGRNERLGQIRSSSVYLTENGSAGIIQQVDLKG